MEAASNDRKKRKWHHQKYHERISQRGDMNDGYRTRQRKIFIEVDDNTREKVVTNAYGNQSACFASAVNDGGAP